MDQTQKVCLGLLVLLGITLLGLLPDAFDKGYRAGRSEGATYCIELVEKMSDDFTGLNKQCWEEAALCKQQLVHVLGPVV